MQCDSRPFAVRLPPKAARDFVAETFLATEDVQTEGNGKLADFCPERLEERIGEQPPVGGA